MKIEFLKKYWDNILLCLIIILGILLRSKGYLDNPSFWHDECGAAWNIKFKTYKELFGTLRFLQVAPPFFLATTKFLTHIFGYSEIVFRFIPFITGCLSIPAFYFLAKNALNKKMSILVAVFLFTINSRLVDYSFEFKPYGVDAFFTVILILLFSKLNLKNISYKKVSTLGILLALCPWWSFVSVFTITAGFTVTIFKNIKDDWKQKALLILPFAISGILYLKICLLGNYTGTKMVHDWQPYFVTLNPIHFIKLLAESFRYLLSPVQTILFVLILFLWGILIYLKERSTAFFVAFGSFIFFLISSFLKIYPFGMRVIVFLIPIYILLMVKPIDLISKNKKLKSLFISILTLLIILPQIVFSYKFLNLQKVTIINNPREIMQILNKNLKKEDIIFISKDSNCDFDYYSSFYNIKNKIIQEPHKFGETEKALNKIPKNKYCWFFLAFEQEQSITDSSWFEKHAKINKEASSGQSKLVYAYIK